MTAATLVLGTRNKKKLEELVEILGDLPADIRDLSGWPDLPDVIEDRTTFEANAKKKASELGRKLGLWVLGEDSGLVVPALGGEPGVRSARYAGQHGDDDANNARLQKALSSHVGDARSAFYVCTIAIADPSGEIRAVVEGRCHGIICQSARGTGGFGYDPLFLIPEYHRTFGELSPRVKHAISHRARALEKLKPVIGVLLVSVPSPVVGEG